MYLEVALVYCSTLVRSLVASKFFYWGMTLMFIGVCMIPTGFLIESTTTRVAGTLTIITGVIMMAVAGCFLNAKERND